MDKKVEPKVGFCFLTKNNQETQLFLYSATWRIAHLAMFVLLIVQKGTSTATPLPTHTQLSARTKRIGSRARGWLFFLSFRFLLPFFVRYGSRGRVSRGRVSRGRVSRGRVSRSRAG